MTECRAWIHYKHSLGFKFIQIDVPDNSKNRSILQIEHTAFQIECCLQLMSLKCWGCTKAISQNQHRYREKHDSSSNHRNFSFFVNIFGENKGSVAVIPYTALWLPVSQIICSVFVLVSLIVMHTKTSFPQMMALHCCFVQKELNSTVLVGVG